MDTREGISIENLLSKLVESLLKQQPKGAEGNKEQILSFSLKLLKSGLSTGEPSAMLLDTKDEWAVERAISRKLMKVGRRENVTEVRELLRSLRSRGHRASHAVVRLLYQLSSLNRSEVGVVGAYISVAPNEAVSSLFEPSGAAHPVQERQESSISSKAREGDSKVLTPRGENQVLWGEMTKSKFVLSERYTKYPPCTEIVSYTRNEELNSQYKIVSEKDLMADVIACLQGVENTRYIYFSRESETYKLTSEVGNSYPQRLLMSSVCELGWMCRKVRGFTTKYAEAGSVGKQSLTGQAFASSLNDVLSEYFRKVAILDGSFKQDSESVTLHRLLVWAYEEIPVLRLLCLMIEAATNSYNVSNYISVVHSFAFHGDPTLQALVNDEILRKTAQPLFSMIYEWITNGRVLDPHKEFIVAVKNTEQGRVPTIWDKYSLRKEAIPPFLSVELANEILKVGKSILYVRNSGTAGWSGLKGLKREDFDLSRLSEMEAAIKIVAKGVNASVLRMLFERNHVIEHCLAMKKYILLGKGDMAQDLLELVSPTLAKSASSMSINTLFSHLDTVKTSPSLQNEEPEFLKHLTIRISELSSDEKGWSVFALDYRLSESNTLLTSFFRGAMLPLWKAFGFLWAMKRVELNVANSWTLGTTSRKFRRWLSESDYAVEERKTIKDYLMKMRILRMAMFHFNSTLQNYFMFDVVERAWDFFTTTIGSAKDFEDAMLIHQRYIEEIVTSPCIADKNIRGRIYGLFDLCDSFVEFSRNLFLIFEDEAKFSKELEKKAMERTEKGEWGYVQKEEEMHGKLFQTKVAQVKPRYDKIYKDYFSQLGSLVSVLDEHSVESIVYLGIRLNYNAFF